MKSLKMCTLVGVSSLLMAASGAHAAAFSFEAFLAGINEVPPNASPATGYATITLNPAETQITVDESWSGLISPAVASHIHGSAPAGVNAGVLFPLTGVPNATAGAIPTQSFSVTAAQVTDLRAGLFYVNVHTNVFPGGEIRGQVVEIPTPEPASLALIGAGSLLLLRRRRA